MLKDIDRERVPKIHKHTDSLIEERIYLDGFEICRKQSVGNLRLEGETLHIMDDEQRIALVETKTWEQDNPPEPPTPVLRYQPGNHQGSSMIEFNEDGTVISYEERIPPVRNHIVPLCPECGRSKFEKKRKI